MEGPGLAALFLLLLGLGSSGSLLPPGCKQDVRPKSGGRPAAAGPETRKVVCSNLELSSPPLVHTLPNRTLSLILNNNKILELKNGSFAGLRLLERFFRAVSFRSQPGTPRTQLGCPRASCQIPILQRPLQMDAEKQWGEEEQQSQPMFLLQHLGSRTPLHVDLDLETLMEAGNVD